MSESTNIAPVSVGFTVDQINKAIETMARTQTGAVTSIAKVMVMAVWASIVNKDAAVANACIKNLRKGMKKVAVVGVLEQVGNLAYVSGTFVYFDAHRSYATAEEIATIKAKCAAWEAFKGEAKEQDPVDVIDEVAALVDRLTKLDSKGKLTHAEVLESLRSFSGAIAGAAVLDVNG